MVCKFLNNINNFCFLNISIYFFSYLALREPANAANSLYRIGDSSSIYASSYICYKFNLIEQAESYGYMCMEKCLTEAAWPTFYKLIDFMDSLKVIIIH